MSSFICSFLLFFTSFIRFSMNAFFLGSLLESFFTSQASVLNRLLLGCRNFRLVGTSGLEPPTSRLSGARSNHLSYAPLWLLAILFPSVLTGGDDGIRTHDPLLAGQVLSQLSYTPISMRLFTVTENWTTIDSYSAQVQRSISSSFWPICDTTHPWKCVRVSIERRWSSRTFRYGYLVTT